ncbi:MAG: hypothetical protein ACT4OJ_03350 [Bacteroidota bacterium]
MKKILFTVTLFFLYSLVNAQCPCSVKAEFDGSDIRAIAKLEWKVSGDFMITVENTGTCGWDKDKVWLQIETKVRPKNAEQGEVDRAFKKLVKHYMTSGTVCAPGETAGFRIRFDSPPYPGRYQIVVRLVAEGSTIATAESRAIDWN